MAPDYSTVHDLQQILEGETRRPVIIRSSKVEQELAPLADRVSRTREDDIEAWWRQASIQEPTEFPRYGARLPKFGEALNLPIAMQPDPADCCDVTREVDG